VQLGEKGLAGGPKDTWRLFALGLAHYRAGQFDQANRRLRESIEVDGNWPPSWPALALVEHGQGNSEEARRWLDKTERWLQEQVPDPDKEPWKALPLLYWDIVAIQVLRREAQALIKQSAGAGESVKR
jgi:tetratricopeptide (TPR) repeat protein